MNIVGFINSSIRRKMLLIMFFLMLTPVVCTTWFEIIDLSDSFKVNAQNRIELMKKNLLTQGKILSLQLSSQVLDNIASFNFSANSFILRKAIEENTDLNYIILMDASRLAYVHTMKPSLEQEVMTDSEDLFAAKQRSSAVNEYVKDGESYLEFIVPIQVSTEPWGVLRLGFSMKPLNHEIELLKKANNQLVETIIRNTLIFVLIMLVLGMIIVFWLSGRMTASILMLMHHAKEMAKGNFVESNNIANMHTGDEIEELRDSFCAMSNALMKAYSGLEKTIEERTAELAEARDNALAATQAKGNFLATMSHEIRTPMNAIIGLNHLALKTDLTSKQYDYLNKIQISARSLLGIINDILDFSKIEAGKLDIECVEMNLDDVLTQLSDVTSELAERKGLELHFFRDPKIPSSLMGDPLRINQILLNLVSNAVKFTQHGEVTVRIELDEGNLTAHNNIKLRFTIQDTGIGLTKKQIARLFQSFSQADSSTTRKYGGTGLGLVICKHLVELMQGKIWIESEPDQGSKFIFTVLLEVGVGVDGLAQQLMPESLLNRKIMVVDDNLTSLEILSSYLTAFHFNVTRTQSAIEAIRLLEDASINNSDHYDLVLIDYKMPNMDGIEATRLIKNSPNIKKIPTIIMVTAHNQEDVIEAAERVHMDAFLTKPVGQSLLFNTILEAFDEGQGYIHKSNTVQAEQHASLNAIKGARLLLVEDNLINQQVAQEILEQAGFQIFIANNGQEAIDMVGSNDYHAILMDLQMPVLGGIEATKMIRELGNDIPIIAMTAHAMKEEVDKCLAAGMNDHTSKPIDPNRLYATLCDWIKPSKQTPKAEKESTTVDTIEPEKKRIMLDGIVGIDLQAALQLLNGNESLLRKLLILFEQQFSDTEQQLGHALDNNDIDSALAMLHNIKGTAGNLVANSLFHASQEFEGFLLDTPNKNWDSLQNNFNQALQEVLTSLRENQH